ncbi:serine protease [Pseudonocardia sp. ICBG1293]|uniref:serine protease n=1 Tax=Pseudonocardia sp. ICBG1293 TaxID=2844382 RepID=UPI001CCF951B|nr:serine protease [Pseudonocardia sp. ICBG1293]
MTALPELPRTARRVLRAGLAVGAVLAFGLAVTGTASAQDDTTDASVHPGVMTRTGPDAAQCTANFVFSDGTATFLGQAAHCAGTGRSTEVDGCVAGSLPLGTPVEVEGATAPGRLVYSSWLSMQERGGADPDTCRFNDFALVELTPDDAARTSPSVPFYGGPAGVAGDGVPTGATVYGYGNSALRQGVAALRPRTGVSTGTGGGGWTHTVVSVPPGVPGDSGSGYLTADGRALGVLSTLNLAPAPGTNGISDLRKILDYANGPGGFGGSLRLVEGDRPFTPQPVPIDPAT